jgi:hypothetical protein
VCSSDLNSRGVQVFSTLYKWFKSAMMLFFTTFSIRCDECRRPRWGAPAADHITKFFKKNPARRASQRPEAETHHICAIFIIWI